MKLFVVAFALIVSTVTFAQSKTKSAINTTNYALFGEKFQPNKIKKETQASFTI